MSRRFAIRVDIDTVGGLVNGVPPMLDLCDDLGVRATYFASVGTDTSARAVLRRPNLGRHRAISPLKKYGMKEILGSLVGLDFAPHAEKIRAIEERGHEVQLHCYNHLDWIRKVDGADSDRALRMIQAGIDAFERFMGRLPDAFASPAFMVTEAVLDAEERVGFSYAGDFLRDGDCIPFRTGNRKVLQIPINAPLIEDLVARGLSDETIISRMVKLIQGNSLTVMYVHPCYEPRVKPEVLSSVLKGALEGAENVTLMEVWRDWNPSR